MIPILHWLLESLEPIIQAPQASVHHFLAWVLCNNFIYSFIVLKILFIYF